MRHIDADELLNKLPDDLPYKGSVKRVLMQAPTADVVEVRNARWIDRKGRDYYTCSNCCTVTKSKDDEYCRCCGAKMDGERK